MLTQSKRLRELQDKSFERVGGNQTSKTDVRIIAATNKSLVQAMKEGSFRVDLFYRLKVVSFFLPPLRDRRGDINLLVDHFIEKFSQQLGFQGKKISKKAIQMLNKHLWPGNVRELVHVLEIAYTEAGEEPFVRPWHLPVNIRSQAAKSRVSIKNAVCHAPASPFDLNARPPSWREFKTVNEANYFRNLLEYTGGSVIQAADISGLGRTRIYDILKKHNITFEDES